MKLLSFIALLVVIAGCNYIPERANQQEDINGPTAETTTLSLGMGTTEVRRLLGPPHEERVLAEGRGVSHIEQHWECETQAAHYRLRFTNGSLMYFEVVAK